MTTIRISKKLNKILPEAIGNRVAQIASEYHSGIKSFNFSEVEEGKIFYVGEGERYIGLDQNGREAQFETVSQNTVGAPGLSNAIGGKFSMPAGSYLIRISYYGKYWMDVTKVTPKLIVEGVS